ncbi:lipoate--protein ligase family protein [Candidatus Woesearchaeota archaeon]|jgi:lipoate---protein ligase|nr:lipoate--protein ligase family protein [Candidatus Woesearchaeota archaeon]
MKWRLIIDKKANDAYTNMAIDEAILTSNYKPTLRLYQWNPPAISVGYFQSLKKEVDIEKCKNEEIDIVRRITGGGAVFHDKELTYSFVCPEELVSHKIIDSYEKICNTIVRALKKFGLDAKFIPINDIIVNSKKISGNAQTRRDGIILQHGTILLDVDVDKMFSLLKVPDEKLKDKIIKNIKERVTSTKHQGINDVNELKRNIVNGFEEEFLIEFNEENLTDKELELAKKYEEKFKSDEWTFKR